MKHVWVNRPTCSRTRVTTASAALPTLTTAMPAPRSISELPSTSTITPPPARSTKTGSVVPTPRATAAPRRANSSVERGPGMAVTRRRSWGSPGPPDTEADGAEMRESVTPTRYCDGIRVNRPFQRRIPLRRPVTTIEVRHPYDGAPVAEVELATPEQVERAVAAAAAVRAEAAGLPAHARAEALTHV